MPFSSFVHTHLRRSRPEGADQISLRGEVAPPRLSATRKAVNAIVNVVTFCFGCCGCACDADSVAADNGDRHPAHLEDNFAFSDIEYLPLNGAHIDSMGDTLAEAVLVLYPFGKGALRLRCRTYRQHAQRRHLCRI